MTQLAATQPATTLASARRDVPTIEELRERVRAIVPRVKELAEQTERDRQLSAEIAARFKESQILRLMQPSRFGGFEYGFSALLALSPEFGRACASTAWCFGLGVVHQWMLGAFPAQVQDEIFGADRDVIIAGAYAPSAQAEAVPGGFKIKGRWGFASGVDNASWSLFGVMFPACDETGGKPAPGFLILPKADYEIEDNWHTVGLAGTGSKNMLIREDVFVPRHRMLTFPQLSSNNPPGTLVNRNPLYRIPFLAGVPVTLVSPALGALRGAIDDFVATSTARTTKGATAGAGNKMHEFATIQIRLAEAEACLDAATLLLERDLRELEESAAAGGFIDIDMRIRNRRDQAFATKLACQGIDTLNTAVGGAGLFLSTGIQRAWRDIHGVSKHISLNWDWVGSMYGQHRLGLVPQGQY